MNTTKEIMNENIFPKYWKVKGIKEIQKLIQRKLYLKMTEVKENLNRVLFLQWTKVGVLEACVSPVFLSL